MQSNKEYYVDEILKLAFLLKQEYAKDERERAEFRSKFQVVVPFTPSNMKAPTQEHHEPSETVAKGKPVFYEPLKFTDKEISKMPKTFRKEFRVEGCTAHIRKRCDGRYKCSYEIRYRRNGYNVSVSAPTLEEAKEKFIKRLATATTKEHGTTGNVPTTFREFGLFWFENFHIRKVTPGTYKKNLREFNLHLHDRFGDTQIKKINAKQLQELIDEKLAAGHGRLAEGLHTRLNQIFDAAVNFGLIARSPVGMIVRKKHEREHGVALTLDEERRLLSETAGTRYQLLFAFILYTGLRPCEYKTAEIRGDMIIARNSKRKHGVIAYKRIPVIPMLKPYLEGVTTIHWAAVNRIREKLKTILPNHVPKDLRTSFNTHCKTSGVDESARKEMMGHEDDPLYDAYTDLPDEFLYQEAGKMVW